MFQNMSTRYQALYKWRGTKIDESDQPTDLDWLSYDGEIIIGRIRFESGGPNGGQWQWSGHGPQVRQRVLPHKDSKLNRARLCERSRNTITD